MKANQSYLMPCKCNQQLISRLERLAERHKNMFAQYTDLHILECILPSAGTMFAIFGMMVHWLIADNDWQNLNTTDSY